MIIFKTIRYKNFISSGNQWTELDLNNHSTVLIVGTNGAGKSTILDALSFVLFGKAFRKINKPQLVNSITQKNAVVEIEFSVGSNDYKIVRGLKPAIFEIYKNGEMINQDAETVDYQEYLEKNIFKFNQKTFCQVVILGTATFQPFMQLTTAQRREVIEDILNLKVFTSMNIHVKDQIAENNTALSNVLTEKKILEEKIKLTYEHIESMKQNNEQIINEKKERMDKAKADIAALLVKYDAVQNKIENRSTKVFDEVPIRNKYKKLNDTKIKLDTKKEIIESQVEYFNHNDSCNQCQQDISNQFKCDKISTLEDEIMEITNEIAQIDEDIAKHKQMLDILDKDKSVVAELEQETNKIKSEMVGIKKYIKALQKEIDESVEKPVNYDGESKIGEFKASLEDTIKRFDVLNEEKLVLAMAASLLKDGGIKARIIKKYIPVINNLINKYLSSMEFMCEFTLDEEFNEKMRSRYRDEFSYSSFSEGEKFRINIAILFAWRAIAKLRNSVNTNLLIMDEVMDSSLDSNGTEEFIKLLNGLTKDTNTFIISHKTDQLIDKFEKVVRFHKVKNFSRIA